MAQPSTPPGVITDNSLMPFGQHKGKPMISVPATYLIYLYDQGGPSHHGVRRYINENLEVLKKEAKKEKRY